MRRSRDARSSPSTYSIDRKWRPSASPDVVHAADVGMRDLPRRCAPPRRTGRAAPCPRDSAIGQKLQRHRLAQLQVIGPIDLSHAAAPEQADDPVALGQDCAGREPAGLDRVGGGEPPDPRRSRRPPRRRRATDGVAMFVGICDADDTASPHEGQKRAESGTSEEQAGHGITGREFYALVRVPSRWRPCDETPAPVEWRAPRSPSPESRERGLGLRDGRGRAPPLRHFAAFVDFPSASVL